MRNVLALLSLGVAAACGGAAPSGGGDGGGSGGDGGGAAGEGGGSRSTLSDGSLGSSCATTCDAGLTCVTDSPGGYCSRACASNADCPGGFCYAFTGGQQGCLLGCGADPDCREAYTCQGDAGATICYPGGGGGGGDCLDVSQLVGGWTPGCGAACEELRFSADGTVYYGYWTVPSGNTETYGTWQASCPNLTVTLTRGYWAPVTYRYTLTPTGFTDEGGAPWSKCGETCY